MCIEVIDMIDYKKMNNQLIAALSDIIDIAESAIKKAENEILSDENISSNLTVLLPKKKEGDE
jgi:hypothetical protein